MNDIELVIKIPEKTYIESKIECEENDRLIVNTFTYAIGNGTPLPKGHGRLIDANYLREDFKASNKISFAERMNIACIVDHAPTIIEADKENK